MPDGLRQTELRDRLVTLPNAITLGRLCVVPLAVWLVLRHDLRAAFGLFVVAGLSDALDGWLARRGRGSALGAALDPLADKVLLVSMFIALAAIGVLPAWLAILVVVRDLLIVGGVLVMAVLGRRFAIRPLPVSKLNTLLQIALVALALFLAAFGLGGAALLTVAVWIVAATTLLSGAAYVRFVARGR